MFTNPTSLMNVTRLNRNAFTPILYQLKKSRTRLFVTIQVIRFEMPMLTERTKRKPRGLLVRFTPRMTSFDTGNVETFVVLTTGPIPPPETRPKSPVKSMLFVALTMKVIKFKLRTIRALRCKNLANRTREVTATFKKTATRPVRILEVAPERELRILYLCRRPLNTRVNTSDIEVGVTRFIMTATITGKRTPAAPEMSPRLQGTSTTCLPPAARSPTTGGRTTGISVTQEHVVITTVFIHRDPSRRVIMTVAGLLVVLTTVTEVVLSTLGKNIEVR